MIILKHKLKKNNFKICVVGLGYVGLPVAVSFSKKFKVIGYDIDKYRIKDLKRSFDKNNSIEKKNFKFLKKIIFTSNISDLNTSNVFIITTPTPISKNKKPDLSLVFKAFDIFKKISIKNKLIILESTVYPEASTKEFIPYLEKISNSRINRDFLFGYSPERINPGDRKNNFENIDKIISGSSNLSLSLMKKIYSSVIKKVHVSTDITTAEMAKVIENIQRDINIAFVNEVSLISNKFKINSNEVLKLSNTKWNFLNFKPGLVGGHCIGVDPYYLIDKLIKKKYKPRIILSGRNINEKYPQDILNLFLKRLSLRKVKKILMMGVSYKANCNDIRNSKSIDILEQLKSKKLSVEIFDPFFKNFDQKYLKKFKLLKSFPLNKKYDAIIISVDHDYFKKLNVKTLKNMCKEDLAIFDIKNIFPKEGFFRL